MEKVNLKILDFEDKKTKAGTRYTRFQTSEGWMSCFDNKVCETLKELPKDGDILCELAISDDERFKNIRGIAKKDAVESQPKEEKLSLGAGNGKNATMYVSYAKDIFIALKDAAKNTDGFTTYENLMKIAIDAVKQAKKEFE